METTMSDFVTEQEFDDAIDLLYSFVDKFVNDDSEDFSMQLTELTNLAYMQGWHKAIAMVLDVSGQMYNGYDNQTLEEMRQRIV
jgi:hypothetical protein